MACQKIFERKENKYLMPKETCDIFLAKAGKYIQDDFYSFSTINSLYYDTPDFEIANNCISKPAYKEKLRMRCYKSPGLCDNVFLELKKKYRSITYKRRIELPLKNALQMLNNNPESDQTQIAKEILYMFTRYKNLAPKMFIRYDRLAFKGVDDPKLRITIDFNLGYRSTDLDITNTSDYHPLLDKNLRLMEIKAVHCYPIWLVTLLDELKLYPTSYSKYINSCLAASKSQTLDYKGGAQSA